MGRIKAITLTAYIAGILLVLAGVAVALFFYFHTNAEEQRRVIISFDTNGGYIADEDLPRGYRVGPNGLYQTKVLVGDSYDNYDLPVATKEGFTFLGWAIEENSDIIAPQDVISMQVNYTLQARYDTVLMYDYIINYYDQNDSPIREFDIGRAYMDATITLTPPSIDGYTFDEKSVITKTITPTTEFNLYYKAQIYTIAYAVADTNIMYSQNSVITYGEPANLLSFDEIANNDSRFVLDNKVFDYWVLRGSDGSAAYRLGDGALITTDMLVVLGFNVNDAAGGVMQVVLDCKYKPETHDVIFISQGEEYARVDYQFNQTILSTSEPYVEGYVFEGWFEHNTGATGTNCEGLTTFKFGTILMQKNDITLYAGYKLREYDIAFDLDGGRYASGVTNPQLYNIESDFYANAPIKDGYIFIGWTGHEIDVFAPEKNLHIFNMTGKRTYLAVYSEIGYTIKFNLNGGQVTNPNLYFITSDDITLAHPHKDGYNFVGWTGTGLGGITLDVVIESGSIGNREYTANYEPITYTIQYELNGGTASSELIDAYNIESDAIMLPSMNKDGYVFLGWLEYDADNLSTDYISSIPKGSTGNKHFKAMFAVIAE